MIDIQWNPSRRELRIFGLVGLPLPLVVGAAIAWARLGWSVAPLVLVALAAVSIVLAVLAPRLLKPISVGLGIVGFPIAWLVNHLILGFIFYGVLTPIGCLLRLGGHDPLRRSIDRSAATYWIERKPASTPESYFRQS